MRRLLSLDFVLEHPGMGWLPTEAEKVEFFEGLEVDRRLIPRRIYYGAVGAQKRYFALKLPVAVDAESVTFVYVDPGHRTDSELRSWGSAHGRLWDTVREKGRQVRVIGIAAEHESIERAERVLRRWATTAPGKPSEGRTVKQEIKEIDYAMHHRDREFLAQYGGFGELCSGRRTCKNCPKRSSRKASRLTTIRHGGPPVLPPAKMGLYIPTDIERNTPREGAGGEAESRGFSCHICRSRMPHHQRGGCSKIPANGVALQYSYIYLIIL